MKTNLFVEFGTILEGLGNFRGVGAFEHPKPPFPAPRYTTGWNFLLHLPSQLLLFVIDELIKG